MQSYTLTVSIDAVVYKSTIYSPRSEFVIAFKILTQIRIYRVDIEDRVSRVFVASNHNYC